MNTFTCPNCGEVHSTSIIPAGARYVTVACHKCDCQMNVYPRPLVGYKFPRVEVREKAGRK